MVTIFQGNVLKQPPMLFVYILHIPSDNILSNILLKTQDVRLTQHKTFHSEAGDCGVHYCKSITKWTRVFFFWTALSQSL